MKNTMNQKSSTLLSGFKNAGIIFLFSLAAKFLSLIRESAIAAYAGTSMEADAYYMVQGIYIILEQGLYVAVFQSFFPLYKQMSLRTEDLRRKNRFTNTVITVLLFAAIGLAIIEVIGRHIIINVLAPGFSDAARSMTSKLVIFSAPMLFFVIAAECASAIWRAHNQFARSQTKDIATHVVAIVVLVLLWHKNSIVALGLSMLVGTIARLLIQIPKLSKIHRYQPCFDIKNNDVKKMFRRIPAALITAAATQLKGIADKIFASLSTVGSVAALNYGHKIETALGGLVSTAIATGLYPEMVALQAQGETKKLRELLDRSIGLFALVSIPLCVGCGLFGEEIVSFIYQRGAFGETEVNMTAKVFAAYILGTFFFGASSITSNVFYGAGDTKTPMKINCVDLILNVVLNLLLFRPFGVAGLALATSLSSIVAYALRTHAVKKHIEAGEGKFGVEFAKIILASLVAGIASKAAMGFLQENTAVVLCLAALIMVLVYLLCVLLLRVTSASFFIEIVKRKLGK